MHGSFIFLMPGVTSDDLRNIDSIFEYTNTKYTLETEDYKCYNSIPKRYYTPEKWIRTSNLRCWECSEYFSNMPAFVPTDPGMEVIDGRAHSYYEVHGNFCSWGCVTRYISCNYNNNTCFDLQKFALFVKNQFTGSNSVKILQAPPKTIMQEYCGPTGYTRNEFRQMVNDLE